MFLGLVFRETAKDMRSILSWRAEAKGVLPKTTDSLADGPKRSVERVARQGLSLVRSPRITPKTLPVTVGVQISSPNLARSGASTRRAMGLGDMRRKLQDWY